LETTNFFHRDLKSLNLLVKDNFDLVLADFGLSRFATDSNASTLVKVCGTVSYCAPEIFFSGGAYNAKCDSYSASVVLWELIVRVLKGEYKRPYSEYTDIRFDFQLITHIADQKLRPTFPNNCPLDISTLITKGWAPDANERPEISEFLIILEKIQDNYSKNKEGWESRLKSI